MGTGAKIASTMSLFFILKAAVVLFFLIMFLRNTRPIWAIGLLTVTSAFLLDTFLGTFGREEMQAELGFFFYVISGALFAGAALWLWGILRSEAGAGTNTPVPAFRPSSPSPTDRHIAPAPAGSANSGFDRQMLYEQIRYRLGPGDVRDLIFDLEMNENDVIIPNQSIGENALRIIDMAEVEEKMGALALAVERILTPIPPENLPRREKLTADSPPTVLRHFLLAHYNLAELEEIAKRLEIDWEQLGGGNKKDMVRGLLLYLDRRNRLAELIPLLQQIESGSAQT